MRPTQRSLRLMRSEGWQCDVVERNFHVRGMVFKRDLFGIGDVIAVRLRLTRLIQTTSGSNVTARVKKIKRMKIVKALKFAGWQIEVHGWRKLKRTGKWEARRIRL